MLTASSYYSDSGHDDEVLDVSFDATGQHLVTGSADGEQTTALTIIIILLY